MRTLILCSLTAASFACGAGSDVAPAQEPVSETAPPAGEVEAHPALNVPALAREKAPESFQARFHTTAGEFVIEAQREWAPQGVDRLYNLLRIGFFDHAAFFRTLPGFIAQFGIHGDPEVIELWAEATIPDDEPFLSNRRGTLSFAQESPGTRTTQIFINLEDNPELDASGFAPVARIVEGEEAIDSIHSGYGELYPGGNGPRPRLLNLQGNRYLELQFPEMDYIESAEIIAD